MLRPCSGGGRSQCSPACAVGYLPSLPAGPGGPDPAHRPHPRRGDRRAGGGEGGEEEEGVGGRGTGAVRRRRPVLSCGPCPPRVRPPGTPRGPRPRRSLHLRRHAEWRRRGVQLRGAGLARLHLGWPVQTAREAIKRTCLSRCFKDPRRHLENINRKDAKAPRKALFASSRLCGS